MEFGVVVLVLSAASGARAATHDAIISGVVRDARGVPQMGAVVQVLSADAMVRATAYTDLAGRYSVARLVPGNYGVRASAALFLPALRSKIQLQPGHRSIVNLTLSTLFGESAWLPARARGRDETNDDWNWTLRSTAGRPILKLADDDTPVGSRSEGRRTRSVTRMRARVSSARNQFGDGMARAEVRGERLNADGRAFAVEASASPDAAGGGGSSDASMRFERPLGVGGAVGGRISYTSHPEIAVGSDGSGLRVLSVSSAERFGIGDFGEIEAGSRMETLTGPASLTVMRPFVRVDVHPGSSWLLTYNLATAPDTQDYDSATKSDGEIPACGYAGGRPRVAGGLHQEIALAHKSKGTVVAVAYYADALDRVVLSGGGMAQGVDAGSVLGDVLVDRNNGTFEALGQGYEASGVHLVVTQVLRDGALLALQYSTGEALGRPERTMTVEVPGGPPQLEARRGQAASMSIRASVARVRTKARVTYRWQPGALVTAIDPYDVSARGEYLSFHVRQPLALPGILPEGMELTVDGSNLLGQGYRQFQGANGVPLYLASSPKSFQAGLAFSF